QENGKGSSFSFVSDGMCEHGISFPLNYQLKEISELDVIILLGGNVMESNPVVWVKILKALNKGADFIVTGFMESAMDRHASKKLRIKPGMESCFLAYLSKWIIEKNGNKEFSSISGFNEFKKSLDSFSWDQLKQKTGISLKEIEKTADIIKESQKLGFIFSPQFSSPERGRANAKALLNLVFLTNARIFPLSAEANDRGWHFINKNFFEKENKSEEVLKKIKKGQVKALFTAAPMSLPDDLDLEFLIIQDSFWGSHMDKADLVLPAAVLSETDGSMVNTEGRIQRLKSPLDTLGKAKPDWRIITEIAQKMGSKDFNYSTTHHIRKEIGKEIPAFKHIAEIDSEKRQEVFLNENSEYNKKLIPLKPVIGLNKLTQEYPLRLRLGSSLDYYRSMALSEEITEFEMFRNIKWIKINNKDAEKFKVKEGDSVVLESKKGKFSGTIHVTELIPEGIVTAYYATLRSENRAAWDLIPVRIVRGQ
ncbi:MAG TPA: molybdopterin-dependent oxidoreductase, partial [Acidobacteriota bacterium]|nr:molybdopterin-dependent oxidoreductase [Acidobacteriota bacterium]